MKKYLGFILACLLIFTGISCDEYLKTESLSAFTEESSFSNVDFATKSVLGIYSCLVNANMYGVYFFNYKIDTDIEYDYRADNNGFINVSHYASTDATNQIKPVWDLFYRAIEYANICIDNLPESPIWENKETTASAKKLYGEAVALRALFYYELISNWGDVPFKTKSTQAGDEYNLPKTDRDEIYEYLIQELKDVEDYVPWMDETTERISKGFVKGLRARMALAYAGYSLRNVTFETRRGRNWEEYYEIARQECLEIMESGKHRLNPDFENIFKVLHNYNMNLTYKESMFEIAFGRGITGSLAYNVAGVYYYTSGGTKYGNAATTKPLMMPYCYSFDGEDIRRDVTVVMYQYSTKQYPTTYPRYASPGKWRREWITPNAKGISYSGVNYPLMRYADIVLMFAEAENELNGPTVAAKEALSLIRERAFDKEVWTEKVTNYVDSVAASKDDFFNAIVDERAWEFGGEFLRKYDLIRWNLLGEKLAEAKEDSYKIMNNDPEYADKVPKYLFYKYQDDGETIEFLNLYYSLPSTAIAGYTRTNWWSNMSSGNRTNMELNLSRFAHGYDPAKNNHLTAINTETLNESNGVLSNDQIP